MILIDLWGFSMANFKDNIGLQYYQYYPLKLKFVVVEVKKIMKNTSYIKIKYP